MSASLDADDSLTQSRRRVSAVSLSRSVASVTWSGSPGPIGAPHTTHPAHSHTLCPMWRIGEDPLAGAPGQMAFSKNTYTPIPGRATRICQFSATQPTALSSGMYAAKFPWRSTRARKILYSLRSCYMSALLKCTRWAF